MSDYGCCVTFSIFTESPSLANYHVEFELSGDVSLNEKIITVNRDKGISYRRHSYHSLREI